MIHTLKYFRTQINSGVDPMSVINEIYQTIAVKNSKIDEMEDKISTLEDEIYDLNALTDEALIPLTKIWCENLKQDFPKFGAAILYDNTTIRLQIPIDEDYIYAQIRLSYKNGCQYELVSCDGDHSRDMYFLLKDIIPNPTPQKSTYGYGHINLQQAYKVFSDLIRKVENL